MIKEIKLLSPKYGEKIVTIDAEDFKLVSKYHWSISYVRGNWYAVASHKKFGQIKMHRLVMKVLDNSKVHIDHKDQNGLNNCKYNLRKATIAQNSRNVGATSRSVTGYRGVSLYTKNRMKGFYVTRLNIDGKKIFGGYFYTAIEAAVKYNELSLKYHGEFGFQNKIDEEELRRIKQNPIPKKKRIPPIGSTGFRGVIQYPERTKSFLSVINIDGKRHYLGYHSTALEAAIAYNDFAIKNKVDLILLNRIP